MRRETPNTDTPRRYHIVQEFNKGVYDYIIATDESSGSVEYDFEEQDDVDGCETFFSR